MLQVLLQNCTGLGLSLGLTNWPNSAFSRILAPYGSYEYENLNVAPRNVPKWCIGQYPVMGRSKPFGPCPNESDFLTGWHPLA